MEKIGTDGWVVGWIKGETDSWPRSKHCYCTRSAYMMDSAVCDFSLVVLIFIV